MRRRLKQVSENGNLVWRITEQGDALYAPCRCEKMRRWNEAIKTGAVRTVSLLRAEKEKALRVTAESEAERIKNNHTEGDRHEENRNQP